jgi:hypothetical protein
MVVDKLLALAAKLLPFWVDESINTARPGSATGSVSNHWWYDFHGFLVVCLQLD